MTIQNWLQSATQKLRIASVPSARLDAELLLAHALKKPREYLLAHPEINIDSLQRKGLSFTVLNMLLKRRMNYEPLAYIFGEKEFYGRNFTVDNSVLTPRPESEAMVDLLRQIVGDEKRNMKYGDPKLNNQITIADIGTGSGCLAITAKLELPQAKVIASDSSKNALKVASTNAQNHKVDIDFFHGSLLDALPPSILHLPYSILLANLPYVPDNFAINLDARHEPRSALFGGVDGLDLYRQLFQQTRQLAIRPVYILSESLPEQHKKMTQIAKANQYSLLKSDGFVQLFG